MGDESLTRPARKQVDAPVTGLEDSNDLLTHNIWHHRRAKGSGGGPRREGHGTKLASEYRCLPALDAGRTRGAATGCGYCCLYFARGICHHGADCNYLHRVPTAEDEARHRAEPQYDIFGRDRLEEARRTKGVGSIGRECTTLYVYLGGAAQLAPTTLQKALREDFGEWGPVDDITVVAPKAIAFVRYRWRSSAEFAKAAMHQQRLRGADTGAAVLDTRWANDDPNPKARQASQRYNEESLAAAYLSAVSADSATKRARLHQLNLSAAYRPGAVAGAYPDTSAQYDEQQYSHQYEGWDARAYAGGGAEQEQAQQRAAVEQYSEAMYAGQHWQHWPSLPGEGDDLSRYLRPGDRLAAPGGAEAAAEAGEAGAAEGGGGSGDEGGAAAAEALALIGGYGTGSDQDGG